jgi:ribosomal protein S18 acetylase RimI-like enzyme
VPFEFELRPAKAEDYDFLYQLHKAAIGDYVAATWGPWDDDAQQARFRERFAATPRQVVMVAGRKAGVLELVERPDELFLGLIEVLPAYQGQGLGTAIIRSVQRSAAAQGRPVGLRVLRVNPAQRLYRRLGFQIVEENETHLTMRWQPPAY